MATIRAGTYRFNDVLMNFGIYDNQHINFTFPISAIIDEEGTLFNGVAVGTAIDQDSSSMSFAFTYSLAELDIENVRAYFYSEDDGWRTDIYGDGIQTVTVLEDTEASEEFAAWWDENTTSGEITADSIKAKLQSLIDKANETTGNTDADLTDAVNRLCVGYATPIEITTEADMTALLENGEVGSIYKYTGETTATYENGGLYIVEAVE